MSFPLVDYDSGEDSDGHSSPEKDAEGANLASDSKQNFFATSDVDSSSGEEQSGAKDIDEGSKNKIGELKNPFRSTGGLAATSVLSNPFKEAEDAEKSSLEKHVKLAPKIEDVREINGRKICWNFRKGRCRFGAKCIYAHDSELLQKKEEPVSFTECTVTSPDFEDKSTKTKKRSSSDNISVPLKKGKFP